VSDRLGNPVPGVIVAFEITGTPGGAGEQRLSAALDTTDASGQVSTILTLGDKLGAYTVSASAAGLSGSPVSFTDTAITGAATKFLVVSAVQNLLELPGVVFTENPFLVRVVDAGNNPVSGITVSFAITSIPTGATGQSLSTASMISDADGLTTTTLTIGNLTGTYIVQASAVGLSNSPLNYTVTAVSGIASIAVKTFLQGPYNTGTGFMNLTLNTGGYLASHFNYSWFSASEVDSIQIEIRNAATVAGSTVRAFAPAWLTSDGTIRFFATSFDDPFTPYLKLIAPPGDYYVVVHHRNHLAIMSAAKIALGRDRTDYDFTTAQTQAYGTNPMVLVATGVYAMWCGDTDGSGVIDATDRANTWNNRNTSNVYSGNDTDLSGVIDATDRANTWNNRNIQTQVP
jgi:hypothetical protein